MDFKYTDEEDDALSHKIQQLLKLQRQGYMLFSPQPRPISETWFDKAMAGIAHALLIDVVWPIRFWWAILRFCIFQLVVTGRIVHGVFKVYSDGDWNVEAAHQYVEAWIVVGGYAAPHMLYRLLSFLFVFGRYVFYFVWTYSLWVFTAYVLLAGLMFLMRERSIDCTNIGWRLIHQALDLGFGIMTLHFRFTVFYKKLWASIKISSYFITLTRCLAYCALRILGHPTFDKLDSFRYTTTLSEPRQIRLLRLNWQNPIMDIGAEIEYCCLDKAPPFEAISYVWGEDTKKEHRIILDGKKFFVTANVYQILSRRGAVSGSRLIWIDSICINQDDNDEKTGQVRMMRDIYHRASHVSICLGDKPNSWLAWTMIVSLVGWTAFLTKERFADQLFYMISIKDKNECIGAQLTAFIDLMDHPWFNRIWVAQEIIVARSANIIYGNQHLPWDQFIRVMDFLFNPPVKGIEPLFQHTGEDAVTRPSPIGPIHAAFMQELRLKFERGEVHPIYYILRNFQAFKSKDPRDKIFALIGLTENTTELTQLIDYAKPLSRILVDVADHILAKGHLLEVLQFAGIGWDKARTDIPSWVVDWSISRDPVTLAHWFVDDHLQYHAAVQRPSEISRRTDNGHIRVRGRFIDCVEEMGSIMPGPDLNERNRPLEYLDEMVAWFDEVEDLVMKNLPAPYLNGQDLREVIWRTLIGDRTSEARPAPAVLEGVIVNIKKSLQARKDSIARHRADLNKHNDISSEPNQLFQDWDSFKASMADMSDITWLCGVPSFPRKFATTENGYISVIPKEAKSGDIICAIWGAQVPFVLRSTGSNGESGDETYKLVGECYVHGMMDGECFNLPYEDQIFEIE